MDQFCQQQSAETIINSFLANAHWQDIVILIGAGNESLIAGLKQHINPEQILFVVDPSRPESDENLYESVNVVCSFGPEFSRFKMKSKPLLYNYYMPRFNTVLEETPIPERQQLIAALATKVIQEFRTLVYIETYFTHMSHINTRHFLLNMPLLYLNPGVGCLKNSCQGSTIAVVGAGPSLASGIQWLKEHRENLFIIAAGSTIKAFQQYGLEADIYVEIDIRSREHWPKTGNYSSSLVLIPGVTPGLNALFDHSYWANNSNYDQWQVDLLGQLCPDIDLIGQVSNSGTAAGALAGYLGAEKVLLIGIDLCLSPEGETHSQFHTHGKDKLLQEITERQMEMVENNRGERCKTIFGGFMRAFEKLFADYPETRFIQTSATGVKFDGAVFSPLESIHLSGEPRPQLPAASTIPKDYREFRKICQDFMHRIEQYQSLAEIEEKSEDPVALLLQRLINIGALSKAYHLKQVERWRDFADYELDRVKQCLKNDIQTAMRIARQIIPEYGNDPAGFRELTRTLYDSEYPVIHAGDDLAFELNAIAVRNHLQSLHQRLMEYYQHYPVVNSDLDFMVAWQRYNMIQLREKDDQGQFKPSVGFFDLVEYSKQRVLAFFQSLSNEERDIKVIVFQGIFDANYLDIINDKFYNFQYILVEPDLALFAEVLRYVPIFTMMNPNTIYLIGEDADSLDQVLQNMGLTSDNAAFLKMPKA